MKIGDYIKENLSIWSIELSDEFISMELSKINCNFDDTITASTPVDLFFYNIVPIIINKPQSVSEGDLSLSFNSDALMSYYTYLCGKLGKENLLLKKNDSVREISSRW